MAQIRDYQQVKGTIESSANYSMTTATPSKGRKTRWGSENTPCRLANFTTAITAPMTNEQIDVYVMQVRIEEITQKLRFNDIVPADLDRRYPSPPPVYDNSGKRVNTRYQRHRGRLEDERHSLIQRIICIIPNYTAPHGYVPSPRKLITDRVYILTKEFSEVKFIGQLLGLRGRSITDMNARSGATIAIRGKGSIKEGRLRGPERPVTNTNTNNQEGPLHCLITAVTQDKVDRAKELVQGVIDAAVTTPERDNERKRHQLRDLAALNGIFRDDEGRGDVVGGARERIAAAAVICRVCSNAGHIARDCPDRRAKCVPWRGSPWEQTDVGRGSRILAVPI